MAHTLKDRVKLLNRAKRIRGQIDGVIRMLESDGDCTKILNTIVASRGAINGFLAELIEGHIMDHVLNPHSATDEQLKSAEELNVILKKYIK